MKLKLSFQYEDNYGLDRRPLSLSLIKAEGFDTRRFKHAQRVIYSLFRFYYQENDIGNKRDLILTIIKTTQILKKSKQTLDATPFPKNENWCHRFVLLFCFAFFLGGGGSSMMTIVFTNTTRCGYIQSPWPILVAYYHVMMWGVFLRRR